MGLAEAHLGCTGGEEERKKQQNRIHRLLLGLGATEEELAAERKAAEAEEPAAPPLPPPAEDGAAANGGAAPEASADITANGVHAASAPDSAGAKPQPSVTSRLGSYLCSVEAPMRSLHVHSTV